MDLRLLVRQGRLPALGFVVALLVACGDTDPVTPLAPAPQPVFSTECRGYIGSGGRASDCTDDQDDATVMDDCTGYIGSGGCRAVPLSGGTTPGRSNPPAPPQR